MIIHHMKPCPVCGGNARIARKPESWGHSWENWRAVECMACGFTAQGSRESDADAIGIWNRRASGPRNPALRHCPLCGGVPLFWPVEEGSYIKCDRCGATLEDEKATEQELADRWNRMVGYEDTE